MKRFKILSFIAISLLFSQKTFAQAEFFSKILVVSKQKIYVVEVTNEITATSIYFSENHALTDTYIIAEHDTLSLINDHDFNEQNRSQLLVFEHPIKKFQIFSGNIEGTITLRMQYVKPLNISLLPLRTKTDSCDKPALIPASEWRKGLTPPKDAPAKNTVKHVIVHHSAGSNSTTNFLEAVRNIYTFHTTAPPNGNGWNDVGYNFLIAQDGTIFQGRDGQGIMDGDNVLGAHFCGKNTGTMGICLLGNYNEVQPSDAAIKSLINLAGWKLGKEKLPVIGLFQHTDGLLNIVSGHRDGCSTECPGNNLYAKLSELRQKISQACTYTNQFITGLPNESPNEQSFKIYPQPSSEFIFVEANNGFFEKSVPQVFDLQGRNIPCTITKTMQNQWQISVKDLSEGTYFLKFDSQQKGIKFLKY